MWFGSILKLFPKASFAKSSGQPRSPVEKRRRARRLLLEPLDARCVMAFSPFSELPGGGQPVVQIAGDFTGDGQQDLVVRNSSGLQLFRGNGDGTFQTPTTIGTTSASSLAAGDLDSDGDLDLITSGEIRLNNGDGTFQPPIGIDLPAQIPAGYHSPVAQQPASVAVGDLNGDGKLDLAITGRSSISVFTGWGYYGPYYNHYSSGFANVLLGNGDGTVSHSSLTDFPQQGGETLALADLDNDNDLDLVAGGYSQGYRFLGNGDGTLQAPVSFGTGGYTTYPLLLGDFDEDGNIDVLTQYYSFWLTRGKGDGSFENPTQVSPNQSSDYPQSVAVGDINADGHLDIAYTTQRVEVTEYEPYYGYYGGLYYRPVAGLVHSSSKVILGRGNGTFSAPITSDLGSHAGLNGSLQSSRLADFDGDGLLDLIAADSILNLMTVALNNDTWVPPPSLSIQDVSIVEGTGGTTNNAVFTVTLDGTLSGTVSVDFATSNNNAIAGVDYTAAAGTLTFGPGVTSRTITVPISGDALDEYDETFNVTLSSPVNAVLVDATALGTILDDDAAPTISIGNVSASEGRQDYKLFGFTVTLSGPSGKPVSFTVDTEDGTASEAGDDYYGQNSDWTRYIYPGETSYVVDVAVRGDRTREADETFFVNLTNVAEATVADGQGVGTILNDDGSSPPPSPPLPQINISDAQVVEGNSGTQQMTFTISLSQASSKEVRVNYATQNGSAKTGNNDYESKSGTIRFAPGETTKTISITVNGDTKVEQDETFKVKLSSATNGQIADSQGIGTILNDDTSSSSTKPKTNSILEAFASLLDSLSNRRKR